MKRLLSLGAALCLLLCACSQPFASQPEEPAAGGGLPALLGEKLPSGGSVPAAEAVSPPDLDDSAGLTLRYLYPLVFAGVTQMDWSAPDELEPWQLVAMYAFAEVWNADIPESALVYEDGWPCYYEAQERVEDYILGYFELPAAHLRSCDWYRPEAQAYSFGMEGGVGFAYAPEVLQAEYDAGSRQLTLYLSDGFGEYEGPSSQLTLRLEADGSFRCLSNRLL